MTDNTSIAPSAGETASALVFDGTVTALPTCLLYTSDAADE